MTYEKPELYEIGRASALVLGVIDGEEDGFPLHTQPDGELVLGLDD
ncbi:MAG: hypothetical protein ACRD2X_06280 [Vicinamibacteraceae bacterium]